MSQVKSLFSRPSVNNPNYKEIGLDQARQLSAYESQAKKLNRLAVVCLLVLFTWAFFTKVPQAAHGTAKVVPSQRLQIIQSVDGGVLTSISVSEGDFVERGQILAQIDTTRFNSSLQEKEAIEASLTLRQSRLLSLLNQVPFTPPENLRSRYPDIYREEITLLSSIQQEWQAQTQVHQEQLAQREREKEEAQSRANAATQSLELLNREIRQVRPLLRTGAVSQVEVLRIEKQIAQSEGDLNASTAQARRLTSAIEEARQKIREAQLQLKNKARVELSEVQGRLASLTQNKIELSDRVTQATMKAPMSGYIQRVLYNTRGAVVPPGQEILEIVPVDDLLVFETRINPKDIGFIRPDQEAVVRVTAYDFTRYGALTGRVDGISADSLTDEQGEPFYSVRVIVDRQDIKPSFELIPGMLAQVSIKTEDRTVLSYLTKPLRRGMTEAFTES